MQHLDPEALIDDLVSARNRGDIAAALACYEADATVVLESGHLASGVEAVRAMLEAFVALRPQFEVHARTILDTDDVALHLSRWTLRADDPEHGPIQLDGESTDVAHRQPNSTWLIAIDNPWGAKMLTRADR